MKINWLRLMITIMLFIPVSIPSAFADEITPPHKFVDGEKAYASEVNDNFNTVYDKVNELEALVDSLRSRVEELEGKLASVSVSGNTVRFTGVNVQIVNGLGSTDTRNGLGNLIVGYDERNTSNAIWTCSDGGYSDKSTCESSGEDWSCSFKSGSHNLVLGRENSYSQYGGLVAGYRNFATAAYSTVTGGSNNTASGDNASVSGGYDNNASGDNASVSGGFGNTASGKWASVSGGDLNTAYGYSSSVSGGYSNEARGQCSTVFGGKDIISWSTVPIGLYPKPYIGGVAGSYGQ